MINPDNVGWLPLLQFAVFDEFGRGADDRVWDYGRRCFEAGIKFEGEHGLMTTNAPKRDSAPAGSVEVDPRPHRVEYSIFQLEQMAMAGPLAFDALAIREAAALLRKLQQGVE